MYMRIMFMNKVNEIVTFAVCCCSSWIHSFEYICNEIIEKQQLRFNEQIMIYFYHSRLTISCMFYLSVDCFILLFFITISQHHIYQHIYISSLNSSKFSFLPIKLSSSENNDTTTNETKHMRRRHIFVLLNN